MNKPWWETVSSAQKENLNKLTKVIEQVNALRKDLEDWKKDWNDNTLFINLLYNENTNALIETNATVDGIQRQLKLRSKMIDDLRLFLDQEVAKITKFNKRNNELIEELIRRKKKK